MAMPFATFGFGILIPFASTITLQHLRPRGAGWGGVWWTGGETGGRGQGESRCYLETQDPDRDPNRVPKRAHL